MISIDKNCVCKMDETVVIELPYKELYIEASNHFREIIPSIISAKEHNVLILDFKNVNYIYSDGIGALLEAWHVCSNEKILIILCNVKPNIQNLFDLTNTTMFIQIVPTVEMAIKKGLEFKHSQESVFIM